MPDELSLPEALRADGGQVLATLVRVLGDLELAQEALQDAVVTALERWTTTDRPDNLAAWLTTTARHKAIDRIRREQRRLDKETEAVILAERGDDERRDREDMLSLIFTCCHPALAPEAQVALCLRTVCQLTTGEIASAFLVSESTMTRRLTRAEHKIRDAHIPSRGPTDAELPDRLDAVLAVVYLVLTTGHHAPIGDAGSRTECVHEAIRLARLLVRLMPDEPEADGVLALCLATAARRPARFDPDGATIALPDQDRALWDSDMAREAATVLRRTLGRANPGPYQLQASIACLHNEAASFADTDWHQISYLYRLLERQRPGPVVRVNRAVAEAEVFGPEHALALLDEIDPTPDWYLYWAACAALYTRLDRAGEAVAAYRRVLAADLNDTDRRHFEGLARNVSY